VKLSYHYERQSPGLMTKSSFRRWCRVWFSVGGEGWPEPYIYTVYDRILNDFHAKNTVHTPYIIYMVLANPKI